MSLLDNVIAAEGGIMSTPKNQVHEALRYRVRQVEKWYFAKVKVYPNRSRTLNILLAIEELFSQNNHHDNEIREILEKIDLKVSSDGQWNARRNRKANECRAVPVGSGKSKEGKPEFWYIVPKGEE